MNKILLIFSLAFMFVFLTSFTSAAIVFDSSNASYSGAGASSLTYQHTVSGVDRILFVGVSIESFNDWVTGITYNGVGMTRVQYQSGNGEGAYFYMLVNPDTGTHNIVVSTSNPTSIRSASVSYTGASQVGQPDASTKQTSGASNPIATALNTVADNSWMVSYAQSNGFTVSASTGTTLRSQTADAFNGIGDSNAPITPPQSYSMSWSGGNFWNIVQASFSPTSTQVITNLTKPLNNTAQILPVNFSASITPISPYNLVNATLTLWNWTTDPSITSFYSNTTINLTGSATNISSIILSNLPFGNYSWNYYGCNGNGANGNCSYAPKNYTVQISKIAEVNQIYSSPVLTGSSNHFILVSMINNTITPASALFNYNGINYTGTWTNAGTNYNFSISKSASLVLTQTNIPFYWIITLSDGSKFMSNTYNQTVGPLPSLSASFASCAAGLVNPYTFYLYNESDATTVINGTFNYNLMYGSVSNSTFVVLFGNITNAPSFNLCFNNTLTNLTLGYGQISYTFPGMDQRTYYLFSGTNLTSQQHNVSLFDLPSTFTSAYKFLVEDNLLNLYVGKYIALIRWYPGLNQYSIVDMGSTDTSGNTILHAVSNDVDYRFGVYEPDGTLDYMAPSQRLTCSSNPCEFTLKIPTGAGGYSNFQKIQYTFTFTNATNTWLFTYSDPTGTTQAVNLTIYKTSGTNVYPICSQLTNGAAGAVSCDTTGYIGDLYGIAFQQNGGLPVVIAQLIENVGSNSPFSSTFGLWLTFLIALPIAFLFIMVSPILGIVGGVIALVPAMYFGSVTWAVIGAFAVLGGIAIHMMRRSAP